MRAFFFTEQNAGHHKKLIYSECKTVNAFKKIRYRKNDRRKRDRNKKKIYPGHATPSTFFR